jgi:NAD(P) transhydrogenase subunit alpha
VLTEVTPGERRVALVPASVGRAAALGAAIVVQAGAGAGSYFADEDYRQAGAAVATSAATLLADAAVLAKVRPPTAAEVALLRPGQVVLGLLEPARDPGRIAALAAAGVTSFALELLPRITRAQSMDALTSQAAVAGYRAVLLAATALPRFFPMLTTPAGTIRPARVLVLGAGVAGLQAIATARRLGATVEAYDVRPAAREQVESLGARFLSPDLDASAAGGYARELSAAERERQGALIADHVAASDAVITTAAVPGRRPPLLVTGAMVARMRPGAVVVDLAAEGGGNCELTRPGETVEQNGVTVLGPLDIASLLSVNASETYARNVADFLALLVHDGELSPAWDDEIVATSLLTRDGLVVHEPTRALVEAAS